MPNDLQEIADILITEASAAFRKASRMAMLVNRDYQNEAAERNKRIDVPIYQSMPVTDVTAGQQGTVTPITPEVVQVTLANWKQVQFKLSDKERAEVRDNRIIPPVVLRGISALADKVDQFIIAGMEAAAFLCTALGQPAGTDVVKLSKELNDWNVPDANRNLVVSNQVHADLLGLAEFSRYDAVGDTDALRDGSLGRKYGFSIYRNGHLGLTHTAGTLATTATGDHAAEPMQSGGTSIVTVGASAGITAGDRIYFENPGNHKNPLGGTLVAYAVVSVPSATTIEIAPRLRYAVANGDDVLIYTTDEETYKLGALAFHQDAYIFCTRPLSSHGHPSTIESTATDPISGITLRTEVSRQYKENIWSIDILYGGKVLYPEGIARAKDA